MQFLIPPPSLAKTLQWNPPHKGHFGDNTNSADLSFVERFSSLRGSKYIAGIILEPWVVSFVERFIKLCPYSGESTIGGSTVHFS